jgi:hypothetical protein
MAEERHCRRRWTAVAFAAVVLGAAISTHAAVPGKVWRVDCGAADPIAGEDAAATLHSLAEANKLELHPGDTVLFRRGTVCHGALLPKGSGAIKNYIRVSAYGLGPRPRIEATRNDEAAVELRDQQFWEIDSLDISGSREFGVHVIVSHGRLQHIVLRDLTVHGVGDASTIPRKKESGLVVINATGKGASFDDVVVDGVVAHDSAQWAGIMVEGAEGDAVTEHVVVRNSMVHDVAGDGIILFQQSDGVIENSIAWHTGMQHTENIGTPNAIWTWACTRCDVINNEAFLTDSPGIDGGAFDIDFWSKDTKVRNNYGHDTQGYCVAVFGAFHVTLRSTVEGNLCIQNGLSPRLAARQGAIFLMTWYGGSIDEIQIEHNAIYFEPPGNVAAIQQGDDSKIRGLMIEFNSVTSTADLATAPGLPWQGHGNTFSVGKFPVATAGAGVDPLPEWAGSVASGGAKQGWQLLVAMPEVKSEVLSRDVVGQLMLLRSQALQFQKAGLRVTLACGCSEEQRKQISSDRELEADGIAVAALGSDGPPSQTTLLINAQGEVRQMWQGALTPIGLGMALRRELGGPQFAGLPAR